MPTALVTGGNKGIEGRGAGAGRAGLQGPDRGAGPRAGEKAAAELSGTGLQVAAVRLNVTDRASIKAAADTISAETDSLDALVNNAGVSNESTPTFGVTVLPSELPEEKLRKLYEVNVFGPVFVTQAFLPLIRKAQAGRIVNVSSDFGSFAMSTSDTAPTRRINTLGYRSSTAALNMVTVQFASELRDTPIKVNAANPGLTATDLLAKGNAEKFAGRPGFKTPEQAVRTIVKLATLPADGPTGMFLDHTGDVLA